MSTPHSRRSMTYRIAMLGALAVLIGVGCDKGKSSEAVPAAPAAASAATGPVTVAAKGQKFEPPIKPEQLPADAWYCDMGTVHWAQMEEGTKTCPLCQMKLKHKE